MINSTVISKAATVTVVMSRTLQWLWVATFHIKMTRRNNINSSERAIILGKRSNRKTPGPPVIGRNPADARFRLPVAGVRGVFVATAGGLLQLVVPVKPSTDVPNWATFQAEFDEYRVLGAKLTLSALTADTGVAAVWTDENDSVVPTASEANQRPHRLLSLSYARGASFVPGSLVEQWKAQNYNELTFIPMSTGVLAFAAFKVYSDTANYAAQASTEIYYELWYDIEFRGIGGDA